ncbi:PLP-dependent aminotransferase family protein [Pseudoalteromonas citrea]|uniref:aminotransferase-like domain-containing protein n=1 Tax=Pseudoalteromonas citrea TaxID=43655 RepID=UPI00192D2EF6|nr:PLP-dependent aminotransferase family protein [Pseudoalteromonas citrea]
MNVFEGTDEPFVAPEVSAFKYRQVMNYITDAIEQGRFEAGEKLPSIRVLSELLTVSKNSVIRAYEILEAQDMVYSVARSGYRVNVLAKQESTALAPPTDVDLLSVAKEVLTVSKERHVMPAGSAHPSSELPAVKQLYAEIGRHSRRQTHTPSHYQLPPGDTNLLKQVLKITEQNGISSKPSDIVITNGAQQAISLAFRAITSPGDIVAIETPCYFGLLLMLESLGLKVLEIPCDTVSGMDINALESALQQWPIKAVLVTPNFSNPSGALMPVPSRKRLLEVCKGISIIEDDVFGGLAYAKPLPSLKMMDENESVIYVSSLSKTLDSRLRIGWVVSHKYQASISKRLISESMGGHNLIQSAVADFLSTGKYKQHLRRAQKLYQENNQQFCKLLRQALDSHCVLKGGYQLTMPKGSFLCWLVLPSSVCGYRVYRQALVKGISILPGRLFATNRQFEHCIRFSLANFHDTIQWRDAITELADIIALQLK